MTVVEKLTKSHNWNLPTTCPCCGEKLEITDTHSRVFCPNYKCKSVIQGRISKWFDILKIKGFGPAIIEDLVNLCNVNNISDLYNFEWADTLQVTEGYGLKSIQKLIDELNSVKKISLSEFVAGYDIEGIGQTQAEKIINEKHLTFETLLSCNANDFIMKGIGEITAKKFKNGLDLLKSDMTKLSYMIETETKEENMDKKLSGLSFCFTGKSQLPRKQLQKIVEDNGGENFSSVKKGLSYLVSDDENSTSNKFLTAKKLGVQIITCEQFFEMVK